MFHPKAWRYKAIMKKWIDKDWYNTFHNPSTSGSSGKIPHADVRRAQQKPDVKQWLQKCKTTLINAPGGTTRRVRPLVVSINKPFKDHVGGLFEQHLDSNQVSYIEGKITAGGRHVFTTKWFAEAWDCMKKQSDVIKHLFKKCGLSNNVNGRVRMIL